MKTSRRPNKRASIENAPGPSRAIAPLNPTTWTTSLFENARLRLTNPIATATIGVINPINKRIAPANTGTFTNQPPAAAVTCVTNINATNARNSSNPNPGQPAGKAGNSFCRLDLLRSRILTPYFHCTGSERRANPEIKVTLNNSLELSKERARAG